MTFCTFYNTRQTVKLFMLVWQPSWLSLKTLIEYCSYNGILVNYIYYIIMIHIFYYFVYYIESDLLFTYVFIYREQFCSIFYQNNKRELKCYLRFISKFEQLFETLNYVLINNKTNNYYMYNKIILYLFWVLFEININFEINTNIQ